MAQENIKITLPISGLECEIKPYLTHKIARKVNSTIIGDTELDAQEIQKGNTDLNISLTGEKAIIFSEILVEGLTLRIGDHKKQDGTLDKEVLDDLAEEDYSAIADKAMGVYNESQEESDPKGSQDGKKSTTEG